jgi:hypothetical protein
MQPAMEKLHDSLSCTGYRGDQHTHIMIEETDRLAALKKVTLSAPNGDWFSFAPDKGRGRAAQMSPLLATGPGHDHHRACDSVIMVCKQGRLQVLYIDLKSENPKGYAGQFKSTRQFVGYVLGLLKEFHGETFTGPEERYVILYGGKKPLLDKKPTVPQTKKIGRTRPDAAFKREVANGARLFLKEFLD